MCYTVMMTKEVMLLNALNQLFHASIVASTDNSYKAHSNDHRHEEEHVYYFFFKNISSFHMCIRLMCFHCH
jgi:hypothetical protein